MPDCIRQEYIIDTLPQPQCMKFTEDDAKKSANEETRLFGHPSRNGHPVYGISKVKLSLTFECKCDISRKYQPSFKGEVIDREIEVYQNFWKYSYEKKSWYERCWDRAVLPSTYRHETRHIINAIHTADTLSSNAKKDSFSTKKECERNGGIEKKILEKKWNEWYRLEYDHANTSSPQYGGPRIEYICL
jgi:hypothetical protein